MKNIYKITIVIVSAAILGMPTGSNSVKASSEEELKQYILEDPMDPELFPEEKGKGFISLRDALKARAPGVSADRVNKANAMREEFVRNTLRSILRTGEFGKLIQDAQEKVKRKYREDSTINNDFGAYLTVIEKNQQAKQELQRIFAPMKKVLNFYGMELAYGITFPMTSGINTVYDRIKISDYEDSYINAIGTVHGSRAAELLARKWSKDVYKRINLAVKNWTRKKYGSQTEWARDVCKVRWQSAERKKEACK